jgi:hypothetical protein
MSLALNRPRGYMAAAVLDVAWELTMGGPLPTGANASATRQCSYWSWSTTGRWDDIWHLHLALAAYW